MLNFPRAGSVVTAPLVPHPDENTPKEECETLQALAERYKGVSVSVVLHRREEARHLTRSLAAVYRTEQKRQHKEKDEDLSDAFFESLVACHRAAVEATLRDITGVAVDGEPLEGMAADRMPALLDRLEDCELLGLVADACRRLQTPTPTQLKS